MNIAAGRAVAIGVLVGLTAVFGLMWPDFDLLTGNILVHRSALTHSLLLPLILLVCFRRSDWAMLVVAGLSIGIAVHLSADVFPRSMRGFATVKLPFFHIGGTGSRLWLIVNMLGGIWLGLKLIAREGKLAAAVAAAATAILALAHFILHDEPFWMLPGMATALVAGHGPARRASFARLRARRFLQRPHQ